MCTNKYKWGTPILSATPKSKPTKQKAAGVPESGFCKVVMDGWRWQYKCMIVGIVSFLAMTQTKPQVIKNPKITFNSKSKKLTLNNQEYTLLAYFFGAYPSSWAKKTAQVLLVDKNNNQQQYELKLKLFDFGKLQFFAEQAGAEYYSDENRFNEYVNRIIKEKSSSAQKNTGPKNSRLPLRFV